MKQKNARLRTVGLWLGVFLGLLLEPGWALAAGGEVNTQSAPADEPVFSFMKARGTDIVDQQDQPVFLRGISFGNRVWVNDRIPNQHHSEEDFQRVADLGMDLVRFYINYQTLESDANPYVYLEDGWQWLDQNIEWARAAGVYLILNMHVPQGGFQSQGRGWDLWQQPELQKRLVAMWRAIAERYRNEPVVFGYDLVNEPGVPKDKRQWQQLAQRLVDTIREVDSHHPVIVERVNSINRKWENDRDMNFVKVTGDNIVYTFHTYDPYYYTHQRIPWDDSMKNRDGGQWPNKKQHHTKADMAQSLENFLTWGKRNNVPLYLGEWGVYKANFDADRGGLNYIRDMLELIDQYKITNTFHVYHEESFGLYRGDGKLDPHNLNRPLQQLFLHDYSRPGVTEEN